MGYLIIILNMYVLTILPGSFELQNINIYILFLILCSVITYNFNYFKLLIFTNKFYLKKIFILILLTLGLSVIFNSKDYFNLYGISKLIILIFGFAFFFFLIANKLYSDITLLNHFYSHLILLGVITAAFGILNSIVPFNPILQSSGASSSFFRHPNTVAFAYIPALCILGYNLLFRDDRNKLIPFILFSIVFFGLALSLSRSGLLAFLISVLILIFFKSKKLFLVLFIVLIISTSIIIQFFFDIKGSSSTIARLGLIYSAVEMIKSSNHILYWGVGTVSVFEEYQTFKESVSPFLDTVLYPHNSILFFILQFGIISLTPVLLFVLLILIKCFKFLYQLFDKYKFLLIPFTICSSLLIQSLLEDTILFPEFFVFPIFLIFLGYLFNFCNEIYKKKKIININ